MKNTRKRFLMIVLVCAIAGAGFTAGHDTVVYITRAGEKYHTERCSIVRNARLAVSLGDAVSNGYEPCLRCKPPILDKEDD